MFETGKAKQPEAKQKRKASQLAGHQGPRREWRGLCFAVSGFSRRRQRSGGGRAAQP